MKVRSGARRPWLRALAASREANVALEFALVAPVLLLLALNILDFGLLIWARMQVDFAAQMGAQAAFKTCSSGTLPATTNCPALNTAVSSAIQSTSLGSAVTLASGYPAENYYCVSGTSLTWVGTYSSPPSPFNCSSTSTAPGDYIQVDVTYSYSPVFSGLSLAGAQTLTGTAMERLG